MLMWKNWVKVSDFLLSFFIIYCFFLELLPIAFKSATPGYAAMNYL